MITLEEAKNLKTINPIWVIWAEKIHALRTELEKVVKFSGRSIEIYKELALLRKDIPEIDADKVQEPTKA